MKQFPFLPKYVSLQTKNNYAPWLSDSTKEVLCVGFGTIQVLDTGWWGPVCLLGLRVPRFYRVNSRCYTLFEREKYTLFTMHFVVFHTSCILYNRFKWNGAGHTQCCISHGSAHPVTSPLVGLSAPVWPGLAYHSTSQSPPLLLA